MLTDQGPDSTPFHINISDLDNDTGKRAIALALLHCLASNVMQQNKTYDRIVADMRESLEGWTYVSVGQAREWAPVSVGSGRQAGEGQVEADTAASQAAASHPVHCRSPLQESSDTLLDCIHAPFPYLINNMPISTVEKNAVSFGSEVGGCHQQCRECSAVQFCAVQFCAAARLHVCCCLHRLALQLPRVLIPCR